MAVTSCMILNATFRSASSLTHITKKQNKSIYISKCNKWWNILTLTLILTNIAIQRYCNIYIIHVKNCCWLDRCNNVFWNWKWNWKHSQNTEQAFLKGGETYFPLRIMFCLTDTLLAESERLFHLVKVPPRLVCVFLCRSVCICEVDGWKKKRKQNIWRKMRGK